MADSTTEAGADSYPRGKLEAPMICIRTLRTMLLAGGLLALVLLVHHLGAASVATALTHITWWQFVLITLFHVLNLVVDAAAWRYAFAREAAPLSKLVAARCAGDAVNVLSAVAAVGGEAVKAWVLRREIPYEESVPSLIVSKTAETVGQVPLLALGILLAWAGEVGGSVLRMALVYLLLAEVIGAAGLLGVQIAGGLRKAGRLLAWAGIGGTPHAARLDERLRGFYRHEWRRFLVSVGLYFVGWLLGAVQAFLILRSLNLPASLATATVIEALWSGVRFATFYVPASLGTLEGANAMAFSACGFSPGAGLAYALVSRASQVVWIGLGTIVLLVMRPTLSLGGEPAAPATSAAE
jgi:glycosyltransferase 2 family protein